MALRNPVYIIGGARSGITFLVKLFDCRPNVLYRHEPDSVLVNTRTSFLPCHEELNPLLPMARDCLDALRHVRATKVSDQQMENIKRMVCHSVIGRRYFEDA